MSFNFPPLTIAEGQPSSLSVSGGLGVMELARGGIPSSLQYPFNVIPGYLIWDPGGSTAAGFQAKDLSHLVKGLWTWEGLFQRHSFIPDARNIWFLIPEDPSKVWEHMNKLGITVILSQTWRERSGSGNGCPHFYLFLSEDLFLGSSATGVQEWLSPSADMSISRR